MKKYLLILTLVFTLGCGPGKEKFVGIVTKKEMVTEFHYDQTFHVAAPSSQILNRVWTENGFIHVNDNVYEGIEIGDSLFVNNYGVCNWR